MENVQEYAVFQTDLRAGRPAGTREPSVCRLHVSRDAGQSAACLLTPEDQEEGVLRKDLALVTRGQRHPESRWMIRQDGTRFWAQWIAEPVYDEAGELRGSSRYA